MIGGVDPVLWSPAGVSVTFVLNLLFIARSFCSLLLPRVDVVVSVSSLDRLPSGMVTNLLLEVGTLWVNKPLWARCAWP